MINEEQVIPLDLRQRTKEVINSTREALENLLQKIGTASIAELLQNLYNLQEVTRTRRTIVVEAYILAAQRLKSRYGFMRSEERLGRTLADTLECLEKGITELRKSSRGRDERALRIAIACHIDLCKTQLKQMKKRDYAPLLE